MGPDGRGGAAVGLAFAGIDHIDLLDFLVAVPVVVGKVDLVVDLMQGFNDHFGRMNVVTVAVITAIVCPLVRDGNRAHDVEGQFELAFTLGIEVVVHRTLKTAIGEVLLVGNALEEGIVVGLLERHVGEVHQDDESFLLSDDAAHVAHFPWCHTLCAAAVGLASFEAGLLHDVLRIYLLIGSAHHLVAFSVFSFPEMTVLVAHQHGTDGRSVGQGEHTFCSRLGRNCTDTQRDGGQQEC